MLKFNELKEQLGARRGQLLQWIAEGMPRDPKTKKFDPDAVLQWLIDNGKVTTSAQPDERIENTRAAAARVLEVTDRTISTWQDKPGFPGKPGTPGKRDGYYPIEKIRDWLATQSGGSGSDSETDEINAAIKRERLRRLKINNDQAEELLVDLEEVRRFIVHTHSLACRELYQLPAKVLQILPADVPDIVRAETRRLVTKQVEQSCEILGNLIRNYDAEENDATDANEKQD